MIISTLESQDFNFQKSDEDMRVAFQIETDNLPVVISVVTDFERQLIRIVAGYSIVFPEDKRVDGAIAACVTNRNLVAGGFDYDYESGEIVFRISSSFAGSVISPKYKTACSYGILQDERYAVLRKQNGRVLKRSTAWRRLIDRLHAACCRLDVFI